MIFYNYNNIPLFGFYSSRKFSNDVKDGEVAKVDEEEVDTV